MFERTFQRAMKYGARLLFFVAVLVVLLSFVDGAQQIANYAGPGGRDRSTWVHYLKSFWEGLSVAWPHVVSFILRGLTWAAFPFFGALVVHRIDQWMASRVQGRQGDV
ncbi:MAG TPA: hypothetical protein VK362_24275 [Reyranella sp.]|nr:hypothetical protein [Reyranella sp.]